MGVIVLVVIVAAALGVALWWGARKSREADEVIRDMNDGRGPGPGIFGIFRKNRD